MARATSSFPVPVSPVIRDALRTYGYTDEQILETIVMVGLAKFANHIAFGLGTVPDFDNAKIQFQGSEATA